MYLSKVNAPPAGPSKLWKDQMRAFILKAGETHSQAVVKGISWHYSHPWERGIDIDTEKDVEPEAVLKAVLEALRKSR